MTPYSPLGIIDSGAYSAFNRGNPIDLQEWIDFCLKVKRRNPRIQYVNLDIIGKPGEDTGEESFENWMKMREAGLTPLPVYHAYSHPKYLKKYLAITDYVGLGAIADMSISKRIQALDRVHEDYLIDRGTRMPKCRTHGMGLTSFPLMRRYSWFSVDSTSWLQAGMYGKVFVPHLTNGKWDYTRKPYQMDVSALSPKQKIRQRHVFNLTPHLKAVLEKHIAYNGFVMGKSKIVDGVEEVIEPGLVNSYEQRCHFNALYFTRFLATMPYPRPFNGSKPDGLFETAHEAENLTIADGEDDGLGSGKTRLYLSGEIPAENFMRERPNDFTNCGVMLTYYQLRMSESNRSSRRLRGLLKDRPYRPGPKREQKVKS